MEAVLIITSKILLIPLFIFAMWILQNLMTKFDDHKVAIEEGNWPLALQRFIGLPAAQLIAMVGALNNLPGQRWGDVGWLAFSGMWISMLLLVSYKWLGRLVNNQKKIKRDEIRNDSLRASIVKTAFYITVGLIAAGSMSGTSPDWWTGIKAFAAFNLLGIAVVTIMPFLHGKIVRYPVLKHVREGSLPAALEMAGMLLMMGIILCISTAGDFTTWPDALKAWGTALITSVAVAYIVRWIVDRTLMRNCSVKEAEEAKSLIPATVLAVLFPITATPVSLIVVSAFNY